MAQHILQQNRISHINSFNNSYLNSFIQNINNAIFKLVSRGLFGLGLGIGLKVILGNGVVSNALISGNV